jgi:inner membrane protein
VSVVYVNRPAHVLFASGVSGILGLWGSRWGVLPAFIAGLGAIIPDLDLRFGHRKMLHNVFAPLIPLLPLAISGGPGNTDISVLLSALSLGWFSHIALDAITLRGVMLFYPILRKWYGAKLCRSDSLLCNFAVIALSIFMILYSLKGFFTPQV